MQTREYLVRDFYRWIVDTSLYNTEVAFIVEQGGGIVSTYGETHEELQNFLEKLEYYPDTADITK